MATIVEVAKLAEVSPTTVSRALNNTGPVSTETRKKIEEAIEMLNYTPDYFAQAMRTSKTNTIGILVPNYANPFYPELFKGIESTARENDYMTIVSNTDEDAQREIDHLKALVNRKIEGIIFSTYSAKPDNLAEIRSLNKKIPVVFIDPVVDKDFGSIVVSDGYNGIRNVVSYLVKLGHKRIACLRGPKEYKATIDRYEGYLQGLADADIVFDDSLVYYGDFHMNCGKKAAEYFLSLDERPTAIIALTDLMAIGILKYCESNEIKVPEEVSVVGFDNIQMSSVVSPGLTTVGQKIEKMGKTAMEILLQKIENPESEDQLVKLETELIVRDSTCPL